jgi:hypothetical protein
MTTDASTLAMLLGAGRPKAKAARKPRRLRVKVGCRVISWGTERGVVTSIDRGIVTIETGDGSMIHRCIESCVVAPPD